MDFATCSGELSHFFIRQNNTSIELHPFGASRLSDGSLHVGRARWTVKVSFNVLLLENFFLVAFARIPTIFT